MEKWVINSECDQFLFLFLSNLQATKSLAIFFSLQTLYINSLPPNRNSTHLVVIVTKLQFHLSDLRLLCEQYFLVRKISITGYLSRALTCSLKSIPENFKIDAKINSMLKYKCLLHKDSL